MSYFLWLVQNILAPIGWVILKFRYDIKIYGKENLAGVNPPLIIASNHKTLFDGFLIGFGFLWFSRFAPMRFMIEDFRFKGKRLELLRKLGMISFFRIISGGFPSRRGEGIDSAIKIPLAILKKGGTVLMFPEGYLIKEDSLGSFFHGTSALALASGAPILPVFIKIKGRNISVSAGKVFNLNASSREEGTNKIRDKILEASHLR